MHVVQASLASEVRPAAFRDGSDAVTPGPTFPELFARTPKGSMEFYELTHLFC
jgi:hypothetical protein